MALRNPIHERIYVDDDLPSFIKTGPSASIMHQATKHGIISAESQARESDAEDLRQTTLSNGYRSTTLPVEGANQSKHRFTHEMMANNKGWDYHFLLVSVSVIVALNIMLYIGFNTPFHRSQLEHIGVKPARFSASSSARQNIDDRIVTLRFAPDSDAAPASDTIDVDTKPHLYVPVIP